MQRAYSQTLSYIVSSDRDMVTRSLASSVAEAWPCLRGLGHLGYWGCTTPRSRSGRTGLVLLLGHINNPDHSDERHSLAELIDGEWGCGCRIHIYRAGVDCDQYVMGGLETWKALLCEDRKCSGSQIRPFGDPYFGSAQLVLDVFEST